MASELAKAYVQIIPSAQGISEGIKREIDPDGIGRDSGSRIGGALKKAIAAAGVGVAVKKIFSDAFSNGGELQQNLGGTEAVFGQYASNLQKTATEAYKNMGLSASDYMATANKMGSLFQGSGVSQQKSLDMTTAAMQRAADVASVMGLDMDMAMESIAGAAKGNFTMMDNLGVAMNATTLQAYALEKGINFDWKTASNAEKSELAMKMFMERTSQYAGNFARESEQTWSGSIGAMSAAYQDLMGNLMLGNDIGPYLQNLASTVSTFIGGNLLPALANIISGLPSMIVTLVTNLAPMLATSALDLVAQLGQGILIAAPQLYETAMLMIDNLRMGIQLKLPMLLQNGVEMLTNIVTGILQGLPNIIRSAGTMISSFRSTITSALPVILQSGANLILNLVRGIINNLPQIVSAGASTMVKFVATIGQNLPNILQSGITIIGKLAAGLIQAIPSLVGKIPQIVTSIKNAFTSVNWGEIGINIIKGIAKGIAGAGSAIINAAKEAAGKALKAAKEALGIHSPSTVFEDEVGKMIPPGVANGVVGNLNPVKHAMETLKTTTLNPFRAGTVQEVYKGSSALAEHDNQDKEKMFMLFEMMVNLLARIADKEGKIVMDDRVIIRILKEWGVVFN